jgi:hypothetical protein
VRDFIWWFLFLPASNLHVHMQGKRNRHLQVNRSTEFGTSPFRDVLPVIRNHYLKALDEAGRG